MRFSSAAPVSFPPWPPNLQLERQGGYLSPPLVEWLSFAVFSARSVAQLTVLGLAIVTL